MYTTKKPEEVVLNLVNKYKVNKIYLQKRMDF